MKIKSLFNNLVGNTNNQKPSSTEDGAPQEPNKVATETTAKEPEQQPEQPSEQKGSSTYNLIILDESGSMSGVRARTISGCNETLNSIRNTAQKHPEIKQYVSIYCFDTENSRYIFQNEPVEETRDLTPDDYWPNACTPLYDAIGYTVSELRKLTAKMDTVAVVTIITDGYENSSRRWNHQAVVELINSLKEKGWVFTFIGANIDVEVTAKGLGIDSYMVFEQSDEGMTDMFENNARSQRAYSEKMRFMQSTILYKKLNEKGRAKLRKSMNSNYFVSEKTRIAPDVIQHLGPDEIFVFGSNVQGEHHGGAALYALKQFGAIDGQAEGIQGQSYAIPTVGNTFEELKEAVVRFTEYVVLHPENKFMLTAIGCGAAGYTAAQIAPLFSQAYAFGNVYIPASFLQYMPDEFNY